MNPHYLAVQRSRGFRKTLTRQGRAVMGDSPDVAYRVVSNPTYDVALHLPGTPGITDTMCLRGVRVIEASQYAPMQKLIQSGYVAIGDYVLLGISRKWAGNPNGQWTDEDMRRQRAISEDNGATRYLWMVDKSNGLDSNQQHNFFTRAVRRAGLGGWMVIITKSDLRQ